MPIREIYQFISAHRDAQSREEILLALRQKGYSEDEIEEAFLVDHFTDTRPHWEKKVGDEEKGAFPTLGDLTLHKKRESGGIYTPVSARHKGEFFIGSLIPLFFYTFGLIFFSPRGAPFPPVVVIQFVIAGASVAASLFIYGIFRRANFDFGRGIPVGVIAMIAASLLFLLIQQLSSFTDILMF